MGFCKSDQTDQALGFLDGDENEAFPVFVDSAESCSFDTSQLTSTLSRRGGTSDQCQNPNDSGFLNVPIINSTVAPFIDIETMELKSICPSRYKTPCSIAVCSSGRTGDILVYPPDLLDFDLIWAQKSK